MDKPHKKLDVWQAAMRAAKMTYEPTSAFPAEEKFGLVSQMRRAAVSIPCNIAEGAATQGSGELRNFLSMAQGSLSELDTQPDLSVDLEFTGRNHIMELSEILIRIDKMLTAPIRKHTTRR